MVAQGDVHVCVNALQFRSFLNVAPEPWIQESLLSNVASTHAARARTCLSRATSEFAENRVKLSRLSFIQDTYLSVKYFPAFQKHSPNNKLFVPTHEGLHKVCQFFSQYFCFKNDFVFHIENATYRGL